MPFATWVWLKIKKQGLRRFWSMFPLTRVPFWYRFFEPCATCLNLGRPQRLPGARDSFAEVRAPGPPRGGSAAVAAGEERPKLRGRFFVSSLFLSFFFFVGGGGSGLGGPALRPGLRNPQVAEPSKSQGTRRKPSLYLDGLCPEQ